MSSEMDCRIWLETFTPEHLRGETIPVDARSLERIQMVGCEHSFCRECMVNHCETAILSREIPIKCPASASDLCSNSFTEIQLKTLLLCEDASATPSPTYGSIQETEPSGTEFQRRPNASLWTRYQRFRRLMQDDSLVACTRCDELISAHEEKSDPDISNDIWCPNCGHSFCRIHGDAHLGVQCDAYTPLQDPASQAIIERYTKPCSHCGISIQKESGCNHVVCANCKMDMCFRCGSHDHLSGSVIRTCARCNSNYVDHRHIWKYRLLLAMCLPIYIPICIVHIAVMSILAVATCGCLCCLGCGIQEKDDDEDSNGDAKPTKKYRPLQATRTVLAMILLPVVDLFRSCGLSCFRWLEIAEIYGDESEATTASSGDIPWEAISSV